MATFWCSFPACDRELLKSRWRRPEEDDSQSVLEDTLGADAVQEIDLFDRGQLAEVIRVCADSRSMADAGRRLFQASRLKKTSHNDSHRLKKYLEKFDLRFEDLS